MVCCPAFVVLTFAMISPWFVFLLLGLLVGPPLVGIGYGLYGVSAGRPNARTYIAAGVLAFALILFVTVTDYHDLVFGISAGGVVLLTVPLIHTVREGKIGGCHPLALLGIYSGNLLIGLYDMGLLHFFS